MSVWDNPDFAQFWNETYGLDMARAPIRPNLIYPLLSAKIWDSLNSDDNLRLVDFGCGNGNLIRAFINKSFSKWVGIDNGTAIIDTAKYLAEDSRISFLNKDIGCDVPEILNDQNFDHAISVFTLEEIPSENLMTLLKNMAVAVCKRHGIIHIFTQHPAYALQQDWIAFSSDQANSKFQGHRGYFDTEKTTYRLSSMNAKKSFPEMANYFHKTLGQIVSAIAQTGLFIREMIEVPAGVITLEDLATHMPQTGDVPRFLYIEAGHTPFRPNALPNVAIAASKPEG